MSLRKINQIGISHKPDGLSRPGMVETIEMCFGMNNIVEDFRPRIKLLMFFFFSYIKLSSLTLSGLVASSTFFFSLYSCKFCSPPPSG